MTRRSPSRKRGPNQVPYEFRYLGPRPGTYWADPRYEPILRDVHAIVLDLHGHAGRPTSATIADSVNTSHATVAALLAGRYLPNWGIVQNVGRDLARRANADPALWIKRLRAAYARVRGDEPQKIKER